MHGLRELVTLRIDQEKLTPCVMRLRSGCPFVSTQVRLCGCTVFQSYVRVTPVGMSTRIPDCVQRENNHPFAQKSFHRDKYVAVQVRVFQPVCGLLTPTNFSPLGSVYHLVVRESNLPPIL